MKRRLIVLRHAKSDWNSSAADDHSRPLNKRGRRDAGPVAEKLVELGWIPERVFSSDAQRTRQTWALMEDVFSEASDGSNGGPEVDFTRDLYLAGLNAVQEVLADVDDRVGTIAVIGHNPGWENAVSKLVGEDIAMTTCNAALLEVEAASWDEASQLESCWKLRELIRPREL